MGRWDSWSEFCDAVRGEAPDNVCLAESFKKRHPWHADLWALDPLNSEVKYNVKFEGPRPCGPTRSSSSSRRGLIFVALAGPTDVVAWMGGHDLAGVGALTRVTDELEGMFADRTSLNDDFEHEGPARPRQIHALRSRLPGRRGDVAPKAPGRRRAGRALDLRPRPVRRRPGQGVPDRDGHADRAPDHRAGGEPVHPGGDRLQAGRRRRRRQQGPHRQRRNPDRRGAAGALQRHPVRPRGRRARRRPGRGDGRQRRRVGRGHGTRGLPRLERRPPTERPRQTRGRGSAP